VVTRVGTGCVSGAAWFWLKQGFLESRSVVVFIPMPLHYAKNKQCIIIIVLFYSSTLWALNQISRCFHDIQTVKVCTLDCCDVWLSCWRQSISIIFQDLYFHSELFGDLFNRYWRRRLGMRVDYAEYEGYRFCFSHRGNPGSRASVLMLHGFSAHKDMWLGVVKARNHRRTVASQY